MSGQNIALSRTNEGMKRKRGNIEHYGTANIQCYQPFSSPAVYRLLSTQLS
jgi:hypothetical protein